MVALCGSLRVKEQLRAETKHDKETQGTIGSQLRVERVEKRIRYVYT